jgi:hypothetical protein
MKYLFFFKGQPLLLCCVCCKIAIQDFLTGLHKKNKKNLWFHRRVYRRTITRRYFTKSCKKFTGFCHIHRRLSDGIANVNYRRNHRRIDAHPEAHACLTRVRLHEYRRLCRCKIPTESPTANACLTRVCLHDYRRKILTESPTANACLTRVRLHDYRRNFRRLCRRIENFGGIFELFWCAFQLIADGI